METTTATSETIMTSSLSTASTSTETATATSSTTAASFITETPTATTVTTEIAPTETATSASTETATVTSSASDISSPAAARTATAASATMETTTATSETIMTSSLSTASTSTETATATSSTTAASFITETPTATTATTETATTETATSTSTTETSTVTLATGTSSTTSTATATSSSTTVSATTETTTAITGTSTSSSSSTFSTSVETATAITDTGTATATSSSSTGTGTTGTVTATTETATVSSTTATTITERGVVSTTLALPAAAGATQLAVVSVLGFRVGDVILIAGGGVSELGTISGIGPIVLADGTTNSYPVGSIVSVYHSTDAPTPAPTAAPVTMAAIGRLEDSVLGALLASNSLNAVVTAEGIVSVARVVNISTDASDESVRVDMADIGASVVFPLSLFADFGLRDAVVVASTVEPGALATFAEGPRTTGEGVTQELLSAISINFFELAGSRISVSDLAEPIRFSLPSSSSSGLTCAWLDEGAGEWTTEGVYADGFAADGSVWCATLHLTFFGAILSGFLSTLQCTQASLLAADSYIELMNGTWYHSVGTQLLFLVLGGLVVMVAAACVLDEIERRRGFWKTEYFLIANAAAPATGMAALAAGVGVGQGNLACCTEGVVGGLKEAVDDLLGTFFAYLGHIRSVLEELMVCQFEGGFLHALAPIIISKSVLRSTSASYFLLADDLGVLLNEDVDQLISPKQGITGDVDDAVADAFRRSSLDCGSFDHVLDVDGEANASQSAVTLAGAGLFSRGAARRLRRLKELRDHVLEHQRYNFNRHANWCHLARSLVMSLLVHGPLGSVFCRSITMSHSLRALYLCCDLLGSMMLATVFCSATGGALSKKSPKGCESDCLDPDSGVDSATCAYMHFGRLIAIGMVSTLIAGVPISILNSLHQREFVRVAYEGSPDWRIQLRKWRRNDAIIWVLGPAYCLLAGNYVCLFFANVASYDQGQWMISACIVFFEDFVILPLGVGFVVALLALVFLTGLSWKYGLARSQITQQGSAESLRELCSNTRDRGDIQRTSTTESLAASKAMRSLRQMQTGRRGLMREDDGPFEVHCFQDVGLADLARLTPRSIG
ncbi:unnamed protein product [Prorocentrum cordatum]|uniref:HRDC domain-containing protein n=3 Tax=Prorocentrum cordatum TaxID=2364126 RepID=A0ABN9QBV6_9DINO|nr:unnamed protein product [Polarella glacialis]